MLSSSLRMQNYLSNYFTISTGRNRKTKTKTEYIFLFGTLTITTFSYKMSFGVKTIINLSNLFQVQ